MFGKNSEKEVYIKTLQLEEGTGRALATMLVKTLEKQQSRDTVKVISSDSCSKNTGWDNGVLEWLKKSPFSTFSIWTLTVEEANPLESLRAGYWGRITTDDPSLRDRVCDQSV